MDTSRASFPAATAADPYRVMVVDDSAVIRGMITRALEGDPEIKVAASVGNGQMAISAISRQPIDVVVLDIEMPVLDGIAALPALIKASPHTKIIMASTLTKRNADISMKAMSAGAADYLPKPSSTRDLNAAGDFNRDLIGKVKAWGRKARQETDGRRPAAPLRSMPAVRAPAPTAAPRLRPVPVPFRPDIIAIGSSTGGPQALFEVLSHLRGVAQPIIVTQHMPVTFTTILAEHISRQCGIAAAEGKDGEMLAGGRCYIAPGNFHMRVETHGTSRVIRLNQEPPENFCRPAVDPMLRSIATVFGRRVLTIILTGMGQDGMMGCHEVVKSGGAVIAQDEPSSVVWGMPGAVATAGLCSAILPIKQIGPYIRRLAEHQSAA